MLRNLTIGSAIAACLLSVSSVFAQTTPPDPVDVAQRCVAAMEDVRDKTVDGVANTTQRVVDRIADLDAAGAPDREIIAAGRAGVERVSRIGQAGAKTITRIERRCVALLVRLEAERDLIMRVRGAAEGFREDVGNAVRRGAGAIRQAVADAIG